jgi:adenylosuccinate synthase
MANGVALDPEALVSELTALRDMGVMVGENLRISDRAHLVMSYHKLEEQFREHLLGRSLGSDRILGTTGRGIGPCYADKAFRDTALRVADLFDVKLGERIAHIVTVKNAILAGLAAAVDVDHKPLVADEIRNRCEGWAKQIQPFACDTATMLNDAMDSGRRVLFEGAHACLLDVDHGTYPYVTSSNSSALGITAGSGVPASAVGTVVGVAKLYASRVGSGPFPTEAFGDVVDALRMRAAEYGTSTGRPRRLGWLDIPALRAAVRINGVSSLCLTGLSMLQGMSRIPVCVGYRYKGGVLDTLPSACHIIDELEPVYEEFVGLDEPVDSYRSFSALPMPAQAFVDFVEQQLAPVRWVCVGRRRDQVLER